MRPGLVGWGLSALTACAALSGPGSARRLHPAPASVFEALVVNRAGAPTEDRDVLDPGPEALAWLRERFPHPTHQPAEIVLALAESLGPTGARPMGYDALGVHGARETFRRSVGNCLSLTHLYVALARALGYDASYRRVHQAPDFTQIGDFAVLRTHIAAWVDLGRHGTYLVDFGETERSSPRVGRRISDDRARAQHFNNLGARALTRDQPAEAVLHFRRALLIDRSLAGVWANLGTALLRLEDEAGAEWALRRAVDLDRFEIGALSALARLYRQAGREALARRFDEALDRARWGHPIVLHQDGREAIDAGRYRIAVSKLKRAARKLPELMTVWMDLGRAHFYAGHATEARRAFEKAAELAKTDRQRDELTATLLGLEAPDPAARRGR